MLNRFGTLTYGPPRCSDPKELRPHVADFFRQMRDGLGGKPLPYVWVPELHKDGVHFHVHFAVGRYVPRDLIDTSWGRGWVSIKLLGDLPVGSGRLAEARKAAGYLSKYVSKAFTDPALRVPGMHRYDLAQGFQPVATRLVGRTADDVCARHRNSLAQRRSVSGLRRTSRSGRARLRSGLSGSDGRLR
jgi:hypothetical protein